MYQILFISGQTKRQSGRYIREVSSTQNICHQCVKPWIREEVVSSVSYAVKSFCHPKGSKCIRGPPGPPGPPGPKGEGGSNVNVKHDGKGGDESDLPKEEATGAINAPGIRVEPSSLTVNEKSAAIFNCFSTVAGKASIVWDKVGGFKPGDKPLEIKNGRMKISSAQSQDAGQYMCTVVSPAGTSRAVVKLKVRGE